MACDLKTFSQYIHELLKVERFQDVALNGIQVEGKKQIRSIATAVTSSLFAIQKAKELHADALITHHGLFLKGKDMLLTGAVRQKVACLLENDINLLAYHLPLDAHEELGNNWPIARQLGWHNIQPFGFYGGMPIGIKATFAPISREKLAKELASIYKVKPQVAYGGKTVVSSCAIISGGAHKALQEAIDCGVDCFVTGTHDEPVWHQAHEEGINFFAFGHAATEKIGVQLLGRYLHKHFGVAHHFIDEKNPF